MPGDDKIREERPWGFFRTHKALSRLRLACAKLPALLTKDLGRNFLNLSDLVGFSAGAKSLVAKVRRRSPVPGASVAGSVPLAEQRVKPVIFASACSSREQPGGWKFNGGIKLLNNLVKVLRQHGYEAWLVTYDGTYEPWLIDHQPHLSLETFREKLRAAPEVRCVTSWAEAAAFLAECRRVYFWDMELAWTEHSHFPAMAKLYRTKLRKTASISRTIQAWHMAHFEKPCTNLPLLIDESLWSPDPTVRKPRRIGYMEEGSLTAGYVETIRAAASAAGLDLEFHLLRGLEADILAGLRTCEVFLGMNVGKDLLWGEGCPLSTLESLSAGCVFLAFDLLGNREIIESGFNGLLVPTRRPDLMARELIRLYQTPSELDRLRANADLLRQTSQTMEARWPLIAEFLELE